MNKKSGFATIPLILGLLLMAVAIPVATQLSQNSQDTRNQAAGKKLTPYDECRKTKGKKHCDALYNPTAVPGNGGGGGGGVNLNPSPGDCSKTQGNLGILCQDSGGRNCQWVRQSNCLLKCEGNCGILNQPSPTRGPTAVPTKPYDGGGATAVPTISGLNCGAKSESACWDTSGCIWSNFNCIASTVATPTVVSSSCIGKSENACWDTSGCMWSNFRCAASDVVPTEGVGCNLLSSLGNGQPGEKKCGYWGDANKVFKCNNNGWHLDTTCKTDEVCGGGSCLPATGGTGCNVLSSLGPGQPGETKCGHVGPGVVVGGVLVYTEGDSNKVFKCSNNNWNPDKTCGPGTICAGGACIASTQGCTVATSLGAGQQGEKKCGWANTNDANKVFVCTSNRWDLDKTCGTGMVCGSGQCIPSNGGSGCTAATSLGGGQPGEKKCGWAGDAQKVFVCSGNNWNLDKTCGPGTICASGTCVQSSSGCMKGPGGSLTGGANAGDKRCDGNTPYVCTANRWDPVPGGACKPGFVCDDESGRAPAVCKASSLGCQFGVSSLGPGQPGEKKCGYLGDDNNNVYQCTANRWDKVDTCKSGFMCRDGGCVKSDLGCDFTSSLGSGNSGERRCGRVGHGTENTPYICTANRWDPVSGGACKAGFVCDEGACKASNLGCDIRAGILGPGHQGEKKCGLSGDSNKVFVCTANRWDPDKTCAPDEVCGSGQCLANKGVGCDITSYLGVGQPQEKKCGNLSEAKMVFQCSGNKWIKTETCSVACGSGACVGAGGGTVAPTAGVTVALSPTANPNVTVVPTLGNGGGGGGTNPTVKPTKKPGGGGGACNQQCPVTKDPTHLWVCKESDGTPDDMVCNKVGRAEVCGGQNFCCPSVGAKWTTDMTVCNALNKCTQCPATFSCYGDGSENKWFATGMPMQGFTKVADSACTKARPTFLGKSKGDANCDGTINTADYSLWHKEFYDGDAGAKSSKTWNADFTGPNGVCDGIVNTADYSLWHKYFYELIGNN